MSDNPFHPPTTDAVPPSPGDLGPIPRPPSSMPGTVIAVLVLVGIYLVGSLLTALHNPARAVAEIGIGVLIFVGLVRRHALAWQWGMIMPILAALSTVVGVLAAVVGVLTAVTALGSAKDPSFVRPMMVLTLGLEISIPVLLSRRRSRLFYGLQCPRCQGLKIKAGNFFFTSFKCRTCHSAWRY